MGQKRKPSLTIRIELEKDGSAAYWLWDTRSNVDKEEKITPTTAFVLMGGTINVPFSIVFDSTDETRYTTPQTTARPEND